MFSVDIVGDFFTSGEKWFLQGSTVQVLNLIRSLKNKVKFKLFEIGNDYAEKIIDDIRVRGFDSVKKAIPYMKGDIIHYNNICYYEFTKKIITGTIHTNVFLNKQSAREELDNIATDFNKIFVVNDQYINTLSGKFKNMQLIYNGVDTDIFKFSPLNVDRNCVKILFPNRNEPSKNREFAINLIQELNKSYPESRFVLSIIQGENDVCSSNIEFFKMKKTPEEMHLLYSQNPITIIPSLTESCSLCALEAMSTGSVVFYNTLPSVRCYVGDAGYMIDVNNTFEWCKKIKEFIDSPQEQEKKRILGYKRVKEKFSISQMSENYYKAWINLSERKCQK